MPYVVLAYIVMTDTIMAYKGRAYIGMACIIMAYIVMAKTELLGSMGRIVIAFCEAGTTSFVCAIAITT